MAMFKFFETPKKEPGAVMDTIDRTYLVKLIVVMSFVTVSLNILSVQLLLERHINRLDKSSKALMAWSNKANTANDMLSDMFKVYKMKQDYEDKGIEATED